LFEIEEMTSLKEELDSLDQEVFKKSEIPMDQVLPEDDITNLVNIFDRIKNELIVVGLEEIYGIYVDQVVNSVIH